MNTLSITFLAGFLLRIETKYGKRRLFGLGHLRPEKKCSKKFEFDLIYLDSLS